MSDIVVTMPLNFKYGHLKGLAAWISEGDAAGDPDTGEEYGFSVGGPRPRIEIGERVYIVHNKHLIGYALLVELEPLNDSGTYWGLWRSGGAVAVTIEDEIPGFQGWRYRWWGREIEKAFPDWRRCGRQPTMPLFT